MVQPVRQLGRELQFGCELQFGGNVRSRSVAFPTTTPGPAGPAFARIDGHGPVPGVTDPDDLRA